MTGTDAWAAAWARLSTAGARVVFTLLAREGCVHSSRVLRSTHERGDQRAAGLPPTSCEHLCTNTKEEE